jgi:DNA-binding MurR/RpiR family transcriptional regulator
MEYLLRIEMERSIYSMTLATLITSSREHFSPSERKVAESLLRDPEVVAFGTLAECADRAGTSGTTVLRLASKLGFDGFGSLQTHVQDDLAHRLRPARQKIRELGPLGTLDRTLNLEIDNLQSTFAAIDRRAFEQAARRIAKCPGRVFVLPGDCVTGIGAMIVDLLSDLRDGVVMVEGNPVRLGKLLRQTDGDDVALIIDMRRYDRWLLSALGILAESGAYVVAFSDSPLSPMAGVAKTAFTVSAEGAGPFDSQVATLALAQALIAAVAVHLAPTATARLDSAESNWSTLQALTDDN